MGGTQCFVRHIGVVTLGGLLTLSCASTNTELSKVAKDWCLTIRASQVLPIYPLSEDVQPGDVFLVRMPSDEQHKEYEAKGFLALDKMLVRLQPLDLDYGRMYSKSYGIGDNTNTPHHWQFPAGGDTLGWERAPLAAFPTYNFHVKNGGTLSLGIPIRGVPIGLNLMRANAADGTVQIAEAHTYGIESASLLDTLSAWAALHRRLLSEFEPSATDALVLAGRAPCNYLRVVARVFSTKRINVSLSRASGGGGSLAVNQDSARAVETFDSTNGQQNLTAINQSIRSNFPASGGSVAVNSYSQRAVSMEETFARPLMIGYVGMDVPILAGGRLGPAISTRERIEAKGRGPFRTLKYGPDANSDKLEVWVEMGNNRERLNDWLKANGFPGLRATDVVYDERLAELRAGVIKRFNVAGGGESGK